MADFYHVWIRPKPGVSAVQIEEKMNAALDWFRCTPSVWILYTSSDEDKWELRLKPLVDPDGKLFICRLDMRHYNGWMTKDFWDWIKKNQRT